MPKLRDPVLQEVIDTVGMARLARLIDPSSTLTKQAVYAWVKVPERWLGAVARVSRRSKHQLRPDLYARNGRRFEQPFRRK